MGRFQKKLELNPVELTLRKEDVGQVLRLLSQEYTESIWEGETAMSEAEACHATLAAAEILDKYALLPAGESERLAQTEKFGETHLLVAEDGSTALVRDVFLGYNNETLMTVDDATGKVVRISLYKSLVDFSVAVASGIREWDLDVQPEDDRLPLEKWIMFLQDYYGLELADIRALPAEFFSLTLYDMCFSAGDGTEFHFSLRTRHGADGYFLLNY